jgi:peptide deformylase
MAKTVKKKPSKFTQWGDPVLHSPTKPVPRSRISRPEFRALLSKMFRYIQGVGVGLAANQIGLPLKLAVIEIKLDKPRKDLKPVPKTTVINPVITKYSKGTVGGWEGCLSCNGVRIWVERAKSIKVTYINEYNKRIVRNIDGWEARVFQHEIDHLNGIVCGERVAIRNGRVMSGALVSYIWYENNPGSTPAAARHLNRRAKR